MDDTYKFDVNDQDNQCYSIFLRLHRQSTVMAESLPLYRQIVLLIGKEKHQFVLNTAVVQRQPLSLQ
jgi:hypothetical protein